MFSSQTEETLYISTVRDRFAGLPKNERMAVRAVLTLVDGTVREFPLALPRSGDRDFLTEYFRAEVYNILINLGGERLDFYIDDAPSLRDFVEEAIGAFHVERTLADRKGYGIAVNVIDRMLRALKPGTQFEFAVRPITELDSKGGLSTDATESTDAATGPERTGGGAGDAASGVFQQIAANLEGKAICGIDIGGSDIKAVLAVDGSLIALKEYDWFPEKYATAEEILDPILMMVRLLRASASLATAQSIDDEPRRNLLADHAAVIDKDAAFQEIAHWVETAEDLIGNDLIQIDAVGLCFPDVVVKDKVVGGEVTKTRGMRNNRARDYETEFTKLTNLDDRLLELCKPGAVVKNINDGPMAAFTAAVELAAGDDPEIVERGVFAHTLGTELGTGWVTSSGKIPEIPLETYNLILDLGSRSEKRFPADDVRSVNNFNTGLKGSIQRFASQSGVFRLALKLLSGCRDDLIQGFYDGGYLSEARIDGTDGLEVPVQPKDMRKAFLEHIMSLVKSESDDCVKDVFRQVGAAMGVAWHETQRILEPECSERILFGRLVKRKECLRLMEEGAKALYPKIEFSVADEELANTSLMKQLAEHPHYTVAQFAQAIGAVYYGHMGLLQKTMAGLE